MGYLAIEMNQFFLASLSPNTRSTYKSGFRAYKVFCRQMKWPLFPLVELRLQFFVTALARRVSYSTIKVYLCGVQFESFIRGFDTRIAHMKKLFYVLRGIRRTQGSSWVKKKRLPITVNHLHSMIQFLHDSLMCRHDKAMWRALILCAFFGLLRVSEYTTPSSKRFDENTNLLVRDVSIQKDFVSVFIKASKTDPFKVGSKIRLAKIGGILCPVSALKRYLKLRKFAHGPLFVLKHGSFVTRKYVTAFIKMSIHDNIDLNTHSFRIGGASAAASSGVPDSIIKILGRWSSDCYRRYIRISDPVIVDWTSKIAQCERIDTIWSLDV